VIKIKGTISQIHTDKNYGFIISQDGEKVFFHKSDLATGLVFGALKKGTEIRYFEKDSTKGKKATDIILC